MNRVFLRACAFLLPWALLACGPSRQETLKDWMVEERKLITPMVKKIPEPKPFYHLGYDAVGSSDPFARQFLVAAAVTEQQKENPDLSLAHKSRKRDPLEEFALESIAFVGTLEKQGRAVGLVRAQGKVFQVLAGQYIGKDFGKILRIDETSIQLREVAQDEEGKWLQRDATLRIQGGSK